MNFENCIHLIIFTIIRDKTSTVWYNILQIDNLEMTLMGFSILHLSDLHIVGKNQVKVIDNMVKDIEEQCSPCSQLAVVITGDVIDKADYTKDTCEVALNFFIELKKSMGDKIKSVQIIPGNHDREQNNVLDEHLIKDIIDSPNYVSPINWNYNLVSYNKYLKLANEIRTIFNEKCQVLFDSSYVEFCTLDNTEVCFVNIDTSWSSFSGEKDFRQLRINYSQLCQLKKEYQDIVSKRGKVFTIITSHHPSNWLHVTDENLLHSWLMDQESFNADLHLCGHTHDRKITNSYDSFHGYLTLVTGIGWPHKTGDSNSMEHHRYSIYNINLSNNCCSINIRKTQQNLQFDFDYGMLVTEEEKKRKRILVPLKKENDYPFIEAESFDTINSDFFFVDFNLLNILPIFTLIFAEFESHMTSFREEHIKKFFIQCELNLDKGSNSDIFKAYRDFFTFDKHNVENIKKLFDSLKSKSGIFQRFISFLQEICQYFTVLLLKYKDSIKLTSDIRIHFRRLFKESNDPTYVTFCQYSSTNNENEITKIRDINYNKSLIKCAFERSKPFVFSHNKKHNILEPIKWQDFMTIAPSTNANCTTVRLDEGGRIEIPILCMAISIASNNDSKILDILRFLRIDRVMVDMVLEYIDYFHINLKDFNKYLQDEYNKTE